MGKAAHLGMKGGGTTRDLTEKQLDDRILALAKELGLGESEARKMLIDSSRVIEGEFEEVEADDLSDIFE